MTEYKRPEGVYSLDEILKAKAQYNLIFGERSNGKTYAVIQRILERYHEHGEQGAYVRRWVEDLRTKEANELLAGHVANGHVALITGGEWTDVYYYSHRWYLCRWEETEKGARVRVTDDTPFMFGFAITSWEHSKGSSFPRVTTVFFDEFMTRSGYVTDEFVMFMNLLSTIIRRRDDVTIFMCANTVNRMCPYFDEMGLRHVREMKQGDIDLYRIWHKPSGRYLLIAVEYCAPHAAGKHSDFYFCFDNKKLEMITGGIWEIDVYPHCPAKYRPKDVVLTYFIVFDGQTLQCEIVHLGDDWFTFIHRKTSELKDPDHDIVFSQEFDPRPNWGRKITKPRTRVGRRIAEFYARDKVFYQDNEVGEVVRNYLMWCGRS